MSTPTSRVAPVRVSAPLARYVPGFTESLPDKGYTALSRVNPKIVPNTRSGRDI